MPSPGPAAVRPDARKTLRVLREEWESCTRCDLGTRRIATEGHFVFGSGARQGIMLIGEGPGVEEERAGEPFVGRSGQLLRSVLAMLGFADESEYYLSNLVACRSCTAQLDNDNLPIFRGRTQVFRDEPPTPPQYNQCLPRLYEEIYLVDPVVIVGLGAKTCEALMQKHVTITRDRGDTAHIAIPGAGFRPVVTDKKQEWYRKIKGEWQAPVEQNDVLYHFVPTLHPAYVARKLADQGADSPFQQFASDLKKAIRTYEAYLEAVFGVTPQQRGEARSEDMQKKLQSEEA
jgi:uracil-DNA glycosylase